MRILISYLSALILSLSSHAGNERGNGGDVVSCKDQMGNIKSTVILDVYEAKEMRGLTLNLGSPHLSVEQKWKLLVERVTKVSPTFARYLAKEFTTFHKEARFLKDIILNDIPDSDHLYIPKGCEIHQIVIQKEPEFDGAPRFVVSNDLWRLLDNDNIAALILHELIYKIAIDNQHQDSKKTRFFSSLIFSGEILRFRGKDFAALISKLDLRNPNLTYLHEGYEFYTDKYHPKEKAFGGELVSPTTIELLGNQLHVSELFFHSKDFGTGVQSINLPCPNPQRFIYKDLVDANFCGWITLGSTGHIKRIARRDQGRLFSFVRVNGQELEFFPDVNFNEYEDVTELDARTGYEHIYHQNVVPLTGRLRFANGDLDLGARSHFTIARDVVMKVGKIEFRMLKSLQNHVWPVDQGNLSFDSAESFPVEIPHQPRFYCGGRVAFHEDGTLESCVNYGMGDVSGLTEFRQRDGRTTKYKSGYRARFDSDGFFR